MLESSGLTWTGAPEALVRVDALSAPLLPLAAALWLLTVAVTPRAALDRAVQYAKERVVFNRPIGKNQSIQHPLAKNWIELEAAWLLTLQAAWKFDNKLPSGAAANAAKPGASMPSSLVMRMSGVMASDE